MCIRDREKSNRPDRLKDINNKLKEIGDKFKDLKATQKCLVDLELKMESVRLAATRKEDPLKAAIHQMPPHSVTTLKDKLNSTNTVSTRYHLLLQVLLGQQLIDFQGHTTGMQELEQLVVELLHFVLEHEGKFEKNYEGIMSWAAVIDELTRIINDAIPDQAPGHLPDP